MEIKKITPTGKQSTVIASDEIFALAPNRTLIAQAIRVYLSNQRQGTSKVKTRSAVARTTAKWYKQKGTGRARHGSRNAPIFVGGGVAHGPTGLENWQLKLSNKQKILALKSVLSAQVGIVVVSDIPLETEGKTKYAQRFLDVVAQNRENCLLIYDQETETQVWRSFANIANVELQSARSLTTYHVAAADKIILTTKGLAALTQRLEAPAKEEKPKTDKVTDKELVTAKVKVAKPAAKKIVTKKPIIKATKKVTTKKIATKKTTKVSKK